jgi:hypothetical protein
MKENSITELFFLLFTVSVHLSIKTGPTGLTEYWFNQLLSFLSSNNYFIMNYLHRATQEILRLLRNLKVHVHLHIHNSLPFIHLVSNTNSAHTPPHYYPLIYAHIFPSCFLLKIQYAFVTFPWCAACHSHLILLDLVISTKPIALFITTFLRQLSHHDNARKVGSGGNNAPESYSEGTNMLAKISSVIPQSAPIRCQDHTLKIAMTAFFRIHFNSSCLTILLQTKTELHHMSFLSKMVISAEGIASGGGSVCRRR